LNKNNCEFILDFEFDLVFAGKVKGELHFSKKTELHLIVVKAIVFIALLSKCQLLFDKKVLCIVHLSSDFFSHYTR
jgi:hypothetical protein